MATPPKPSVWRFVAVPVILTAAVAAIRCYGELAGLDPTLFPKEPRPGLAIGITWLIPVFGFWFGWRLARRDLGPKRAGLAITMLALGLGVLITGALLTATVVEPPILEVPLFHAGAAAVGILLALTGWPRIVGVLLLYALLTRLVVIVLVGASAMLEWDTHYLWVDPDRFADPTLRERVLFNIGAQATFGVGLTTLLGGLFGAIAAALHGKRRQRRAEP